MIQGFAKTAFFETYQRSPWKVSHRLNQANWPLLSTFFIQQRTSYLDYILTHRLLHRYSHVPQEIALFICHLIMAAREGHLCIQIHSDCVIPDAEQIWQKDGSSPLSSQEIKELNALLVLGAQQIPPDLITEDLNIEVPLTPLCRYHNCIYLQRHWIFESLFLRHLKHHLMSSSKVIIDKNRVQERVQNLLQKGIILPEQAQAIEDGCLSPISLITGGPGTGKTYTAGQLIKVLWESLSPDQRKTFEIALAAPTGKAVANLQGSLSKIVTHLEDFPPLTAKTLHMLLGIRSSGRPLAQRPNRLNADLIVVDESSMIDIRLMAYLFQSIKKGSRLILLGDPHQLPSVEAGSVFADLVQQQSLQIPCTQLKVCLRAELRSIVDFAMMINQGKNQEILEILKQDSLPGIKHVELSTDRKEAHQAILSHSIRYFPSFLKKETEPQTLLNLFQATRILSPMRKGPFGVDTLNHLFWNHFSNINQREGWLAIPIMIVSNDYRRDLFNGETGVLVRRMPLQKHHPQDYALFPSRIGQEIRCLSAALLPKYEYAYCLSVHKSQGSEFDHVILVMPNGSELFGREVFYTAVTRARKQIDIYGSDSVLSKTILQKGGRLSGITQRLLVENGDIN